MTDGRGLTKTKTGKPGGCRAVAEAPFAGRPERAERNAAKQGGAALGGADASK